VVCVVWLLWWFCLGFEFWKFLFFVLVGVVGVGKIFFLFFLRVFFILGCGWARDGKKRYMVLRAGCFLLRVVGVVFFSGKGGEGAGLGGDFCVKLVFERYLVGRGEGIFCTKRIRFLVRVRYCIFG